MANNYRHYKINKPKGREKARSNNIVGKANHMQIHCIHTTVPILTEVKATKIKTESVQA